VLAVVLVASLGVVLTSCESSSPPPADTTTGGGGDDITIPKVKLFENTSPVAPNLLKEVWYERTVNAHKIYVKTTFVASNYIDALKDVEDKIASNYVNKGDIWGLLLIGIDRVNKSTPKKNIINFGGFKVKTADSNFEFDALIRVNSYYGRQNTRDGLPVVAENNNFLLETWDPSKNKDIEDDSWWEGVSEKKYQGGTDSTSDAADKFVSGSYTEVTNEYGETNRLDANVSYNASTGEYVITIPFTIIPFNDIDKIVVFGAQHAGWRPGATVSAVVKPLGSSKALVYADVNNVVAGIPVVKVPKSKNESPSLIPGSFPDVISSLATSIDAKSGAVTTNISVELVSVSSNASNIIVFTGPQGSSTNYVTNWLFYGGTNNQGDHLYTNDIVLSFSAVNDGSDFYVGTNYTVRVVAGNGGNATISVTVEPTISLSLPVVAPNTIGTANVSVVDGYDPGSKYVSNITLGTGITLAVGVNSFTIGEPNTADLVASNGNTIVLYYPDSTSGKTFTVTNTFVVIPLPNYAVTNTNPNVGHWGAANTISNLIVGYATNNTSKYLYIEVWGQANGNSMIVTVGTTNISGGSTWLGDDDWYGDNRWFSYSIPYQIKLAKYDFNGSATLEVRKITNETTTFGISATVVNAGDLGDGRIINKVWIPFSELTGFTNIFVAGYVCGGGQGWASSGIPAGIIDPNAGSSGGTVTNQVTNFVTVTLPW
jgi:hypothetical protein